MLAEIERCASAVFKADSADLARYRMSEIRNYVAMARKTGADTTAAIAVPDPATP